MKQLYSHQKKFIEKNPNRGLLLHETGLGKTVTAIEWLKLRPERKALVICPKAIVGKWRKELIKWGGIATVITRDQIKVTDISSYRAIICDEMHDFVSPLFTSQRSQRATKLYLHLKNFPDTHLLGLSATIIRSTPWNLHSLYCYMGKYWPVKDFQNKFFYLTDSFGKWHLEPKKDWRIKIRPYLEEVADIALMEQCVDVPIQEHIVIKIPYTKYKSTIYTDSAKEWHDMHRAEQNEAKWKKLKELIDGHQKILVVVYYRDQIEDYIKRLGDEREVFVVHGGISDQESVLQAAQVAPDCVLIVQSGLGSGFDADTFSTMVFASQGYSYVSLVQMQGRIKRIHNLHRNIYYYLIAGEADQAVFDAMEKHSDFDPIQYMKQKS